MRADLHVHSKASSDGSLSEREILKILKAQGFEAVAILDHNTLSASLKASEISGEFGLIVVNGVEISSVEGHIGALGIRESIERDLSAEETIEKIHELGGIAVALHPYRFRGGLGAKVIRRCRFDALEAINARTSSRGNLKAERLRRTLELPATGGSDSHFDFDLGMAFTSISEDCQTEEDIIRCISKGETRAEGKSRSIPYTITYVKKTLSGWISRGFSRI